VPPAAGHTTVQQQPIPRTWSQPSATALTGACELQQLVAHAVKVVVVVHQQQLVLRTTLRLLCAAAAAAAAAAAWRGGADTLGLLVTAVLLPLLQQAVHLLHQLLPACLRACTGAQGVCVCGRAVALAATPHRCSALALLFRHRHPPARLPG
jgi:hypothetical protein